MFAIARICGNRDSGQCGAGWNPPLCHIRKADALQKHVDDGREPLPKIMREAALRQLAASLSEFALASHGRKGFVDSVEDFGHDDFVCRSGQSVSATWPARA